MAVMKHKSKHLLWSAFALLLLALPTSSAKAQLGPAGIGFRNDTQARVLVQGHSVVAGMIRRGKPLLILSQRTGWDLNPGVGDRFITIYDSQQPGRVLFRGKVVFRGVNILLKIRPNPRPGGYPLIITP